MGNYLWFLLMYLVMIFFFLYVHACCKRLLFWLLKHCDYFCISLLELINFSFSALINYDLLLMDEYAVDCSIYLLSTLKVIQLIHFSLFFFSHMCNGHNNSAKILMLVIQITNVSFQTDILYNTMLLYSVFILFYFWGAFLFSDGFIVYWFMFNFK